VRAGIGVRLSARSLAVRSGGVGLVGRGDSALVDGTIECPYRPPTRPTSLVVFHNDDVMVTAVMVTAMVNHDHLPVKSHRGL
jgi:hypothetical protein